MNIKRIPTYAYFPNTQGNFQMDLFLVCDQELHDRIKNWSSYYDSYSFEYKGEDVGTGIITITDNLFQTNVLSRGLKYYMCKYPTLTGSENAAFDIARNAFTLIYNNMNSLPVQFNVDSQNRLFSDVVTLNNKHFNCDHVSNGIMNVAWSFTSLAPEVFSLNVSGGSRYCSPDMNFRGRWYMEGAMQKFDGFFSVDIPVFPSEDVIFNSDGTVNPDIGETYISFINISGYYFWDQFGGYQVDHYRVEVRPDYYYYSDFVTLYSQYDDDGSGSTDIDSGNPYGKNGLSNIGGGDGTLVPGSLDSVDPAEIPDLPTISACDIGFMTMYNPTITQLKALSDFMWSGVFDLDTYKKLFSDPMESIIGLAIVPVAPQTGGSKNVMFGTIDSGVSMTTLSSQYVQLDCGSVAIEKFIGSFLDSDPYTKISIYLPYIGIRQLSADDIIGGSIRVVYNVDVLTGACGCFIEHSSRGVLYSYNGSCITNVPLTAANFSGAIQNAVSAVISGIGTVAGAISGAAPLTAMGVSGLLNSAANTAINSKPSIQRSGNLGGSAGIMSIQKPFVIIERPSYSVPSEVEKYVGQTSNITATLGECKGFTMCEYIHMQGCWGTENELKEIEALLKEGVVL